MEPLRISVPLNGTNSASINRYAPTMPPVASEWELTQYERQRKPQPLVSHSNIRIQAMPDDLRSELVCPICLDLLRHTKTTKECLHRFCGPCIVRALRSGNKECPTCRKKLVSKRSLQDDVRIDAIISKLFPNREESDSSLTIEPRNTPQTRRGAQERILQPSNVCHTTPLHATSLTTTTITNSADAQPVKIVLRQLDSALLQRQLESMTGSRLASLMHELNAPEVKRKCIVVPMAAYVEHLIEFLKKRDNLPASHSGQYQLYVLHNDRLQMLSNDDSLENVCRLVNYDSAAVLNIFYRFASSHFC